MARHIAYDVGAAGVARALGEILNAPVVMSHFSRLVIDPNRGEDDPTLVMKLYDGSVIPGNRHVDAMERERRLNAYYRPYHAALTRMSARRDDIAIVAIHSFTQQLHHRPPRPWHVGVLHAEDTRLSDPLIDLLEAEADLVVGRNQPYSGHLQGDAIDRHALAQGRHNTLIEVRNDLIEEEAGQDHWAARLAPLLERALALAEV
jgi:predicted N-formylglutamate amidohydrolase